ncbi:hypothetical protein N7448_006451 [Penicillium atrosanguineum]|uniref:Nicotinamide N-methyltransferase n=1 Tax=Penicillium atrosanguineum TaxID=1132637 RepID=A0A9W9GYN6_9EURO|nr:hypothetical protein N7448_006451 [Penicillium atrosanguineum]KAJ5307782.1 hypothetical protein N7476_008438 [Penicillium atrosanguineum]
MLQSRLRPLPRHPGTVSAPAPDFEDHNNELDENPEDVFEAFLSHLFPDDAPAFHGNPGQHLLYSSPHYGELEIMVPSYPAQSENKSEEVAAGLEKDANGVNKVEEERQLFAHFLWSSALVVAEGLEDAERSDAGGEARDIWSVKGESVLELGAGAALPSLISAIANASRVVATDHPSSPALAGAIKFNMDYNLRNRSSNTQISIEPHEWGVLDSNFALQNKGAFTRIIAADCYWMPEQHENLVRTIQWFMAPGGKLWVVAGMHTGRGIVARFFEIAAQNGLEVERIFERDLVNRKDDGEHINREWRPVREDEGPENWRRWGVIAVLKRKG